MFEWKLISSLCPYADDIWINAMARYLKLDVVAVSTEYYVVESSISNWSRLADLNLRSENDRQICRVESYFNEKFGVKVF